MPFSDLPNELVLIIASELDNISLSSLSKVNKRYHLLLENDFRERAIGELSWAIKCRKLRLLRCLVVHHVKKATPGILNYGADNQWPILHETIYQKGDEYLDLTQKLFKHGADVNLRWLNEDEEPFEQSPLEVALGEEELETASVLIGHGALPNFEEESLAELAKLVNLFIENGADPGEQINGQCFMDRASADLVKEIAMIRLTPPHSIATCALRGVETAFNRIKKTPMTRQRRGPTRFLSDRNALKEAWAKFEAVHGAFKSKEVPMVDSFYDFWNDNHAEIEQLLGSS
ncbi:uncharacterized protein BDZ99DRAFT_536840 [Mytilinidion resinicola]|uniref:F-box domain-containing protein n=1 Tax=Mytilinidion resinicola TaxID=574789 RepID=A0A6A6YEW1_9PEZI|nr:uncharacterized protein BDZ99DRAFT_536840 [Mytilinidion resinicola]KAF2807366.1 hypothetical protein BDZ99DRAFT_536840 [Mytilinidion resinicola]